MRRLRAELERCASCAEYYRRHQNLESQLCGVRERQTPFALERVEDALFESIDATSGPSVPIHRRQSIVRLAALVTVFLVVLAAVFLRGTWTVPETHRLSLAPDAALIPVSNAVELTARGTEEKNIAGVGIRVFAVAPSDEKVKEKTELHLDDIITFTYTRIDRKKGYLTLFGLQPGGDLLWYYPDYAEEQSLGIQGDKVDEPLGDGFKLAVNHRRGLLRIVSLFTERPIEKEEIESTIEKLGDLSEHIKSPDGISWNVQSTPVVEHSILLEIVE